MSEKVCNVPGCGRIIGKTGAGKGLCALHYSRERRGRPLEAPVRGEIEPLALISVRVTASVKAALEAEAVARGEDLKDVVRRALEQWVGQGQKSD